MSFFSRPSSSAVKIVAPSAEDSPKAPPSPKPSPKRDSTQRQCRNILIYGSCKFQDKGCIYYHPPREESPPAAPESPVPRPALPAEAVNAPIFVPKATVNADSSSGSVQATIPSQMSIPSSISSAQTDYETAYSEFSEEHDPYDPHVHGAHMSEAHSDGLVLNPYSTGTDAAQMVGFDGLSAMDALYTSHFTSVRQPLNYHLYTLPRPDSLANRYFISDTIREELQMRSETIHIAPAPGLNLPEELQGYHTITPLELIGGERRKFWNWYSTVYRAISSTDGVAYVLRRIENFRLMQQAAFSGIEAWSRLRHPNVVSIREGFTTRAFGDSSLVVVYDYHPNAQTLYDAHIKPKVPQFQNGRLQAQAPRLAERTVWSYVVQIASAIKAVHDAGLAVRIIDATKILVTENNRVRIGSCGIVDVLTYESRTDIAILQQEDLVMFGKLVFALCNNNLAAMNNFPKAVENLGRHYSPDLKAVALFLVSKPGPNKTIGHLSEMIGSRLVMEMDEMQNAVDRLESELMSELENGRLVRLLCKFGFINERPEFAREPRWSETGDRYIIKLFRDYVFHQVDDHGNPVVNLSHVLTCLNKLDAGSGERIMLVSRDEQSCLVVSYKEVKACIDSAFGELSRR
ncbi:uncharacterized protein LAESUDRAFT_727140 [Laetiporus sulphureus 93-53]|uniref:PAN2-PAN3 deadenylation complex subunit PAN3 n=1 Tax=Laetiporus sulphureus 93-53 TaxID=1314785 RepID=A0A165DMJ2_9APHY|nr:uncharacterized protein LAESUDRAFT_727140 [Laetiporus sulphureus 93-53]KZT05203.1 hypothetical protein LAESUDRAFT_727140 [Laetiporus sulphureus 93-53]